MKPASHPPTHRVELTQLIDKLQLFTIVLKPHPTTQPNEELMHTTMQSYMDTLFATQREANLIMSLLQDIPTFEGLDSSALADWLMDLETAADVLTESTTHQVEAKFHGLTHTLIHEALQAGKYWGEVKGIL